MSATSCDVTSMVRCYGKSNAIPRIILMATHSTHKLYLCAFVEVRLADAGALVLLDVEIECNLHFASVQRGVPPDSTSVEHGLCSGEGFGHNHHQGLFLVKAIESASHINRVNICQETHLTSRRPCCSLLLSPASKDPLKHYLKSSVSPLAGIHASLKISKEPIQLGVQD